MSRLLALLLGGVALINCGAEPTIQAVACPGHAFVVTGGPAEIAGEYCGVGSIHKVPTRWSLRANRTFSVVRYYPPCPEGVYCARAGGEERGGGTYRQAGTLLWLSLYGVDSDQLWTVRCDGRDGISLVGTAGKVYAPSGCP
jgi:hypothetical protein